MRGGWIEISKKFKKIIEVSVEKESNAVNENSQNREDTYRKNPRKLNAIGKPMSVRESLWEWWKCKRESLPAPQLLSSPLSAAHPPIAFSFLGFLRYITPDIVTLQIF